MFPELEMFHIQLQLSSYIFEELEGTQNQSSLTNMLLSFHYIPAVQRILELPPAMFKTQDLP